MTIFFVQTAFMLLGGSALVGPGGARALFLALSSVYELVFLVRLGQTPGKDAMHVKVVAAGGGPVPIPRAVVRWLPVVAAAAVPDLRVAAGLLGALALAALLAPGRRGLHDRLAGTSVVAYDADREEAIEPLDLEPLDRLRRERRDRFFGGGIREGH